MPNVQPKPTLPAPKRELVINRIQLLQLKEIDDVKQLWFAKKLHEASILNTDSTREAPAGPTRAMTSMV